MTFNDNADVGGSRVRRRGAGVAVAGGGVAGLGVLAVIVLNLLTGGDFSSLLSGGAQDEAPGTSGTAIGGCRTGADANRDDTCRLAATSVVLDDFWASQVRGYTPPELVIVDRTASTPCGTASNATGPFYCPPDQTVYIDPTFFAVLHEQFGASAGSLAQMYVLAHEYGHHVQRLTGIMQAHPNTGTGPASNGVRTELQADCFAGAWVADASTLTDRNGVTYLRKPTDAQVRDALDAASAVGDDRIQREASGKVNPEAWTHGSSTQRQRWFTTGYRSGTGSCDTFAVAGGAL